MFIDLLPCSTAFILEVKACKCSIMSKQGSCIMQILHDVNPKELPNIYLSAVFIQHGSTRGATAAALQYIP